MPTGNRGRLEITARKGEPLHDLAESRGVVGKPGTAGVVFADKIGQNRLRAMQHHVAFGEDRQRAARIEPEVLRGALLAPGMDIHCDLDAWTTEHAEQKADLITVVIELVVVKRQLGHRATSNLDVTAAAAADRAATPARAAGPRPRSQPPSALGTVPGLTGKNEVQGRLRPGERLNPCQQVLPLGMERQDRYAAGSDIPRFPQLVQHELGRTIDVKAAHRGDTPRPDGNSGGVATSPSAYIHTIRAARRRDKGRRGWSMEHRAPDAPG